MKDVQTGHGTRKVVKKVTGGNVKELLRKLMASVPLTKYASLDNNIREYLLYTLICAHAYLGYELVIPEFLKRRVLDTGDYERYGAQVAGTVPRRYAPPIPSAAATAGTAP